MAGIRDAERGKAGKLPTLLSVEELSSAIGRPVETLNDWRKKGIGPTYYKMGGRVMYDVADVLTYLSGCKRVPSVRATLEGFNVSS